MGVVRVHPHSDPQSLTDMLGADMFDWWFDLHREMIVNFVKKV